MHASAPVHAEYHWTQNYKWNLLLVIEVVVAGRDEVEGGEAPRQTGEVLQATVRRPGTFASI